MSYNPGRPGEAHDLTFNHGSWRWPFWTGIFTGTVSLFALASIVYLLKRHSGHTEGRNPTTQLPDGSLPLTQVIEQSRPRLQRVIATPDLSEALLWKLRMVGL